CVCSAARAGRRPEMERPSSSVAPSVYLLVAVAFAVVFVATAIKGVYQVYFVQLAEHFGRGRAQFAWSGALFMLATGLASPLVGALRDRVGALRAAGVGACVAGVAFMSASLVDGSLWVFALAFGLCGAFGLAAMTFVPMGVLVDRLFDGRSKGLAYAVITNGTSIGFIVLSPAWVWLQPQVHWTQVFLVMGSLFAVPLTLALCMVARFEPPASAPVLRDMPQSTWRTVRHDPVFYVLAFGFMGCGATMAFIDVHL